VKKGQLLFVIEEAPYRAALDVAIGRRVEAAAALARANQSRSPQVAQAQLDLDKASLTLARIEEARTRALVGRRAAPAEEYDKVTADLRKAEAQVESDKAKLEQATADYDVDIRAARASLTSAEAAVREARIDLAYCRIHSPIDGRIGEAKVKVGNLVGPASGGAETTELASIQQLDPMGVDIETPSRYLARAVPLIRAGLPVSVSKAGLEGDPIEAHRGVADFIDNTIKATTSTFLIKAHVANAEGSLLPGDYVKADIIVEQRPDTLVIPEAALVETQAGPRVFTVDEQGRVAVVPVRVGVVADGTCTIDSGLAEGATLIVGGTQSVRPGMIVKAEDREAAAGRKS
jgi:membrane fusion protein (multidrug efflux system)